MSRRRAPLLLLLMVLLAGCSTVNVRTDWDDTAEFDSLQRYYWVEPPERDQPNPFADNDLLRKRMRAAVDDALQGRGYRAVDTPEKADFLITWDLTLEERFQVDGYTSGGFYYGNPRYWGGYTGTSTVRPYQESTLLIDILDPASRKLIWRGWASGVVRTRDRTRDEERLRDGVRQILEAFPPNPSKS